MFDQILNFFIVLAHISFIIFVAIGPIIESNYFLLLHCIAMPFLMLHWVMNNDACAIVIMEKILREKLGLSTDPKYCISARLVEPMYNIVNDYPEYSRFAYTIAITATMFSGMQLYRRYNEGYMPTWRDWLKP